LTQLSQYARTQEDTEAPPSMPGTRRRRPPEERPTWRATPFFLCHLVPLAAIFTGVSWTAVWLCAGTYAARMFFISAGYHRYFSHRTFKLSRVAQFLMALGGTTSGQKGPLWWAANHRTHHRFADTDRDPHSPQRGLWWSHVGWILCDKYRPVDYKAIRDFSKYPELRFVDRHWWIGTVMLGAVCFLVGGWSGLVVGFFLSTVFLWHAVFAVNSVAHLVGRRRYQTTDTSRNSFLLAVVTGGEGWHNNHHHYQTSSRQGFFWWELDATYYVLKAGSALRLVRDMRSPPPSVLAAGRPARRARGEGSRAAA
jgi:stearoyl-CoA desaturase (delta-9 desaturase)